MSALGQRYGAALAGVAFDHKDSEKIRHDLSDFAQVFASSPDLRNLFSNPSVSAQAKKSVAEEIAAKMGLHEEVRNFIFILIDHRRTAILHDIQQAFDAEMNRRMGVVDAIISSAHELSAAEKSRLTTSLERVTGKKIQAQYQLNPQLIGGARVQIGSTIYDGTVRERLNRLRSQLQSQ